MKHRYLHMVAAGVLASSAACASAGTAAPATPAADPHAGHQMPAAASTPPGIPPPAATPSPLLPGDPPPRPELVRQPYSTADVKFMQGMIPHHAQALIMAGYAKTNGASPQLQLMCERMIISQRDEIAFMRTWLRDRGQFVPLPDAKHLTMDHDGMKHDMLMPGMLTDAELDALSKARGKEWERLFLIGMIKHHQGAIGMVEELFASHGAAQDDHVYLYASDVYADQQAEIERMELMLAALGGGLQ
jgi:uncharacterized protein (DUF305 family)